MTNQHVMDITILWPDDKWHNEAEQAFLISAMRGITEFIKANPIENREYKRSLFNNLGRQYATLHFNPAKEP